MIPILLSTAALAQDVTQALPAPAGTPAWVMWAIGGGGASMIGGAGAAVKAIASALRSHTETYAELRAEVEAAKDASARAELAATAARDTAAEAAASMGGMTDIIRMLTGGGDV